MVSKKGVLLLIFVVVISLLAVGGVANINIDGKCIGQWDSKIENNVQFIDLKSDVVCSGPIIINDKGILDCHDYSITFSNSGNDNAGVLVSGANGATIKNCRISGFVNGIYVYRGSSVVNINNNVISNNKETGVVVANSFFVHLKGNEISNNGNSNEGQFWKNLEIDSYGVTDVPAGVLYYNSPGRGGDLQGGYNIIENNNIINNKGDGLRIEGIGSQTYSEANYNKVRGNTITGNIYTGIRLHGGSENNVIENNNVCSNGVDFGCGDACVNPNYATGSGNYFNLVDDCNDVPVGGGQCGGRRNPPSWPTEKDYDLCITPESTSEVETPVEEASGNFVPGDSDGDEITDINDKCPNAGDRESVYNNRDYRGCFYGDFNGDGCLDISDVTRFVTTYKSTNKLLFFDLNNNNQIEPDEINKVVWTLFSNLNNCETYTVKDPKKDIRDKVVKPAGVVKTAKKAEDVRKAERPESIPPPSSIPSSIPSQFG